jgi:pilus assembly protein CpaB
MGRTSRFVLVLVVAVAVAAGASFLVYRAMSTLAGRQRTVDTVATVVAARSVPVGTLLTKDDVKTVAWPAGSTVPNSFRKVDEVVGRGAVAPIAENEPLTAGKLAASGVGGGLPPTIPEGMRAISVKTNDVVGVAGFVVPGTRVDVVVTVRGSQDEGRSRVVVSNVQVLAAGTRFDQEKARADGKPIPTSVVTLLVTPEDAERIALATSEGQITLTLRNPLDVAPTETKGVAMNSLFAPPAPPPIEVKQAGRRVVKAAPPPEPAAPKPYTVEAIRAAKRSEEPIR